MSKPEMIHFIADHAMRIRLREPDLLDLAGADLQGLAEFYAEHPAVTAVRGMEIVFCCGAILQYGVASLWALTSPLLEKYPVLACKTMLMLLFASAEAGCHRVQATVHKQNPRAKRFLERFGFQAEGLLRASGPNRQDRWMMANLIHKNMGHGG